MTKDLEDLEDSVDLHPPLRHRTRAEARGYGSPVRIAHRVSRIALPKGQARMPALLPPYNLPRGFTGLPFTRTSKCR